MMRKNNGRLEFVPFSVAPDGDLGHILFVEHCHGRIAIIVDDDE
jgi:hypothetical protein